MIGMKKYGVLFVCTGNICRSPTAEAVFRHRVTENGLLEKLVIDSAGTHGYHIGEPPDRRAIAAARARGIQMDDLRARLISPDDFETFSLIVAMDSGHHGILQQMSARGRGPAKLSLFLDFAADSGLTDVPDPYYGGTKDFEEVLDLVENGVAGLLSHIQREI